MVKKIHDVLEEITTSELKERDERIEGARKEYRERRNRIENKSHGRPGTGRNLKQLKSFTPGPNGTGKKYTGHGGPGVKTVNFRDKFQKLIFKTAQKIISEDDLKRIAKNFRPSRAVTFQEAFVQALFIHAINGHPSAIGEVLNRLGGKVKAEIEHTGEIEKRILIVSVNFADLPPGGALNALPEGIIDAEDYPVTPHVSPAPLSVEYDEGGGPER